MMIAIPVSTVPTGTDPSSNRGTMTSSITQRIAKLEATVETANPAAPSTARTNRRRCRPTID